MEQLQNDSDRRASGRIAQNHVSTDLGPIVDISRGGLRLRCRRRLVGDVTVNIFANDEVLPVLATVIWTRRIGFRRHDVGLAFRNPDSASMGRLTRIASQYAAGRAI